MAAINYYFKSKKEMMAQMEKLFMDNLHDAFTPVCEKTLSPDERLKEWVKKSLGYARRYPGILVFLKDKFSNPKDNEFENAMRRALSEKFTLLRELILDSVRPERQEEELLIMTLGAVMLLPLSRICRAWTAQRPGRAYTIRDYDNRKFKKQIKY